MNKFRAYHVFSDSSINTINSNQGIARARHTDFYSAGPKPKPAPTPTRKHAKKIRGALRDLSPIYKTRSESSQLRDDCADARQQSAALPGLQRNESYGMVVGGPKK